ncbi:MAG TPA: extracellular solute-binding protein [Thermomicrobiales bacterium]|nr:extracellular solute-binding protein [Thermomicrobiales bacterium]
MPRDHAHHTMPISRRLSRRAFAAGGVALALGLVGCGGKSNTPAEIVATPTPEPTQAPPMPTQPPIASPVAGYLDPKRWAGRTLTVATAGVGDYLDALTSAFFDAFAHDTGAVVRHEQFGRDGTANLMSQVDEGEILWDVMLVPMNAVLDLSEQGYLTAIDYNVVDNSALYPQLTLQHGVGAEMYSTTMVYSVSREEGPADWADFWNLQLFDGTRALRRSPVGTLEFALLADGVQIDKLYPLDTERAFASLEKIREATLFYEDSKQPVELVRTGQVGLASAWTVRTTLPDVASLVTPVWNQGMISADAWVTPRGTPNTDVAMSFINYATRAVPTANFSRLQPFGPVNQDALKLLKLELLETLPNYVENFGLQFFENLSYWRDHRDRLTAQFEDWLLNPPATPEVE